MPATRAFLILEEAYLETSLRTIWHLNITTVQFTRRRLEKVVKVLGASWKCFVRSRQGLGRSQKSCVRSWNVLDSLGGVLQESLYSVLGTSMPQLSIYAPHVLLLRKANGQALNKLCVLRLVNDSCSFELEIWRANDYKSHIKKHSICMLDNDLGNDLDNCGRWGNALKDKK